MHRQDWLYARYRVEACDKSQIPFCSRSIEQSAAALELETIGYLVASKADAADGFGFAVATSADGTTLAIGAPYEDCSCTGVDPSSIDEAAPNAGAVYVFVKNSSGWRQHAYIKASTVAQYDLFGMTVALSSDGNTLAIGAPTANGLSIEAVHVFGRSGSSWRQAAVLTASNGGLGDRFGSALALSADGRTLAVGATGEDSSGDRNRGERPRQRRIGFRRRLHLLACVERIVVVVADRIHQGFALRYSGCLRHVSCAQRGWQHARGRFSARRQRRCR